MRNYSFYITIFFLLSVLLIIFLIFPKYQNLNLLKKEISGKEDELSSQEEYFESLQKTSEELKKYEDSLLKIDTALPQKLSLPEFLNFIQKASSQSNLSLRGMSPAVTSSLEKAAEGEPRQGRGGIKETRISFVLAGDYSDFKNFLSILEKSARLIDIENFSFSSSKEGQFNFNLAIKVYSY